MKKIINTDQAPSAIGTYSQAVLANDTLYMSGQIPLDPVSMEIVEGDFKTHVHQVFKNLQAVLAEAEMNFSNIVKLNIFLTDMSTFPVINEIMAQYFSEPYPARAAVGVKQLPKDVAVEMDAIAIK